MKTGDTMASDANADALDTPKTIFLQKMMNEYATV